LRGGSDVRLRSAQVQAVTLALACAAFAAFSVAALAWGEGAEGDVRFVRWVHGSAPDGLVDAMRVLTYLGSVAFLAPLVLVAALLLVRGGLPWSAVFVVTAFVVSEALDQGLKAAFRRARPRLENPFAQLTTYSFPSGHAFAATATYGALALVFAAGLPRARAALFVAAAVVVVAVVAASRVVLGVHYLLDVLAGIAGGLALLSALLLVLGGRIGSGTRDEKPERARLDA
jgi:membrane-associated phospholipid phosphatase